MSKRNGSCYERQIMRHLTEKEQEITFEFGALVPDASGRYLRRVEIWLPQTREIIECKNNSRPVPIGMVDTLVGTMADIGISNARMFSHSGFTRKAIARAEKAGIACTSLPFEERHVPPIRPTGVGRYTGDYVRACGFPGSGPDLEGAGRVNYDDGDYEAPLCVGYSLHWGNVQMRKLVAHIVLTHHLGGPPSGAAIDNFHVEYGDRLKNRQYWEISEVDVWRFAASSRLVQ